MKDEANKLLMMFIKDGYSASGEISKKTAIAMMKYVASDKELQQLVNECDHTGILNH